jgi:hypothetical protein
MTLTLDEYLPEHCSPNTRTGIDSIPPPTPRSTSSKLAIADTTSYSISAHLDSSDRRKHV